MIHVVFDIAQKQNAFPKISGNLITMQQTTLKNISLPSFNTKQASGKYQKCLKFFFLSLCYTVFVAYSRRKPAMKSRSCNCALNFLNRMSGNRVLRLSNRFTTRSVKLTLCIVCTPFNTLFRPTYFLQLLGNLKHVRDK